MNEIESTNTIQEIKIWKNQRVVTFKDIDEVHQRPKGTASRNFKKNRNRFIENVDYFQITKKELGTNFVTKFGFEKNAPKGMLFTESGYLMLVKSLTDDLSWKVQRELVNGYFRSKEIQQRKKSSKILNVIPSSQLTWYQKKLNTINEICRKYDITKKYFIHHLMTELSNIFNMEDIYKTYEDENGHVPKYPLDIIDQFPQIEYIADLFLAKCEGKEIVKLTPEETKLQEAYYFGNSNTEESNRITRKNS